MRKLVILLLATLCLSQAGMFAAHAGEYQSAPYTGSKEYEMMRRLVGSWEGTSNMGKEGDKVKVEYRMSAGGSALVETLFPGKDEEMVSVYHDRKGKLAMTHYCMLRNQPRMTLSKADAQMIELVFDKKGNDINLAKEKHMHAVRITFTDKDHITQDWTLFENGKKTEVATFRLTRAN